MVRYREFANFRVDSDGWSASRTEFAGVETVDEFIPQDCWIFKLLSMAVLALFQMGNHPGSDEPLELSVDWVAER